MLFDQWGQHFNIVCIGKARARVDLQAGEAIVVGETDLQNAKVSLQPLLLIDHQIKIAGADGLYCVAGHIKAGSVGIVWAESGGFNEGLDRAGQVAVIGNDQLDVRVCGNDAGEDWHAGGCSRVGGIIDFLVARGITRARLPADNEVICTLRDPQTAEIAVEIGNTRSAAAMRLWGERMAGSVVAIGNAPTALFYLLEMLRDGKPGFVTNASDGAAVGVVTAVVRRLGG